VPITTIGIQQGAGSTQPSPSDDGSHGKGPQVSSGGVRPPGRGEPSEQPERREPTQLGSYDDQIRGEGPRGPSGGGPSEDKGKGLPAPSVHEHTMTSQQDRKGLFDTQHTPPVPPKHTPATTEPLSLKGHGDAPAIPHRLPSIPNGYAPTVPDPHSQPQSGSVQSHKDKNNSRPKGNEGDHRGSTRSTRPLEGPSSGQKQGCWTRFKRWCAEHCCCCC
jgi:hypothetical protein